MPGRGKEIAGHEGSACWDDDPPALCRIFRVVRLPWQVTFDGESNVIWVRFAAAIESPSSSLGGSLLTFGCCLAHHSRRPSLGSLLFHLRVPRHLSPWWAVRLRYSCQLEVTHFTAGVLYFGYMFVLSTMFFLLTGVIGYGSCLYFNNKIYGAIKVD